MAQKTKRRPGIKRGDKVVVTTGIDKSDEPHEVLRVIADGGLVVVKGVNMRWKHLRRSQANPKGGRVRKEFPIDISNVMLYSEKAQKGVRTRLELKDGKKIRIGTCGTVFD
ncbi:MAG: 50S ribosomal protein L24 [Planctomycetota bacterium]|jgi:large subunit ribosomal protein L24